MDFNPEYVQELLCNDLGPSVPFLTSDLTVADARIWSISESLFKKWIPQDTKPLERVALQTFLECNTACQSSCSFDSSSYYYDILMLAKQLMAGYCESGEFQSNVLTLDKFVEVGKTGPGASISARNGNDMYHKLFCGKLSTYDLGLYKHYFNSLSDRWLMAEFVRHETYGLKIVKGSKTSTVPKNRKTNRTICTEAGLNMYYQLGAGACLERLLKTYHNIDLSLQPDVNRALAREGSISGAFATIDLASASDTISTRLVQFLLPKQSFAALDFIRAKRTEVDGKLTDLDLFSSMGNGFTFPLQTLIFATLVRAYYLVNGIAIDRDGIQQYSCFGDDIICTREAYFGVTKLLEYCGFRVNDQKSFNSGPFRESCGSDYFLGHDIRGVYIKEVNYETQAYSVFNRLARWCSRTGHRLPQTLRHCRDLVKFRPVPLHAGDSEGHRWPLALLRNIKRDRNGAHKYRATVTKSVSRRVTGLNMNYDGAIICFIAGHIRDYRVGWRCSVPTLKVVKRVTPHWDYVTDPGFTNRDLYLVLSELS